MSGDRRVSSDLGPLRVKSPFSLRSEVHGQKHPEQFDYLSSTFSSSLKMSGGFPGATGTMNPHFLGRPPPPQHTGHPDTWLFEPNKKPSKQKYAGECDYKNQYDHEEKYDDDYRYKREMAPESRTRGRPNLFTEHGTEPYQRHSRAPKTRTGRLLAVDTAPSNSSMPEKYITANATDWKAQEMKVLRNTGRSGTFRKLPTINFRLDDISKENPKFGDDRLGLYDDKEDFDKNAHRFVLVSHKGKDGVLDLRVTEAIYESFIQNCSGGANPVTCNRMDSPMLYDPKVIIKRVLFADADGKGRKLYNIDQGCTLNGEQTSDPVFYR
jgi:hypothetical protein